MAKRAPDSRTSERHALMKVDDAFQQAALQKPSIDAPRNRADEVAWPRISWALDAPSRLAVTSSILPTSTSHLDIDGTEMVRKD